MHLDCCTRKEINVSSLVEGRNLVMRGRGGRRCFEKDRCLLCVEGDVHILLKFFGTKELRERSFNSKCATLNEDVA